MVMNKKKPIRLGLPPKPRLKRGMTLIELLISLFIIALMTGVAIPLFSAYQRRNTLDTDTHSIASIFAYARALQNNPDVLSRFADPTTRGYTIKIFTGSRKVIIYPKSDPNYIIDQFTLARGENLTILTENGEDTSGGFTISFSGKQPAEKITCSPKACPNYLVLSLWLAYNPHPYAQKTIYVQNTTATQYFFVTIN